jgi:predicted TPR repeat methyltransferase
VALDAAQPQAHNNLATLHRRHGRWTEAEAACRQALQADPDLSDAWYNLSLILLGQGRVREGLEANSRAILLWPRQLLAREQVLRALIVLGQLDEAARLYRDWLAEDPDNPVVQHQYAACLQGLQAQGAPQPQGDASDQPAPSRASDAYVETLFDHFAASFDAKLGQLHYRAPELVATAVREALGEPPGQAPAVLNVADLGCGTGLCGPLIRPWAARLAGCDLSVGMLRQAKARGVYDLLHKAELVYYLDTQPGQFDLLVCADTLCYFGDLQSVLAAARRALQPGGHFIFTVEGLGASDAAGWQLQPNGRYAHTLAYLEVSAAQAGLTLQAAQADNLRQEAGQPVSGWVVTLVHPGK